MFSVYWRLSLDTLVCEVWRGDDGSSLYKPVISAINAI